jgi:hypothetical protein
MVDRSQRFIDNAVEFNQVFRLLSHLTPYLEAQGQSFRAQRLKFLVDIREKLGDLRIEMDHLCIDKLSDAQYERLDGLMLYGNTQERQPMDPMVSLITDAEPDPLWRQRIDHIADRFENLLNSCISLDARDRREASKTITVLQELVPILRGLSAVN